MTESPTSKNRFPFFRSRKAGTKDRSSDYMQALAEEFFAEKLEVSSPGGPSAESAIQEDKEGTEASDTRLAFDFFRTKEKELDDVSVNTVPIFSTQRKKKLSSPVKEARKDKSKVPRSMFAVWQAKTKTSDDESSVVTASVSPMKSDWKAQSPTKEAGKSKSKISNSTFALWQAKTRTVDDEFSVATAPVSPMKSKSKAQSPAKEARKDSKALNPVFAVWQTKTKTENDDCSVATAPVSPMKSKCMAQSPAKEARKRKPKGLNSTFALWQAKAQAQDDDCSIATAPVYPTGKKENFSPRRTNKNISLLGESSNGTDQDDVSLDGSVATTLTMWRARVKAQEDSSLLLPTHGRLSKTASVTAFHSRPPLSSSPRKARFVPPAPLDGGSTSPKAANPSLSGYVESRSPSTRRPNLDGTRSDSQRNLQTEPAVRAIWSPDRAKTTKGNLSDILAARSQDVALPPLSK
jgi:uncharacterized protein YeaC (DUF1315 family)